jgi:cytochrome c556
MIEKPRSSQCRSQAARFIGPSRYSARKLDSSCAAMMRRLGLSLLVSAFFVGTVSAQDVKTDYGNDRAALTLTPPEKAYVLDQMRHFVGSIQSIAAGLADEDRARAVEAAAARGLERNANDPAFPPTLAAKLPDAWKQFGGAARKGFDILAQGIADGDDTNKSLKQLGEVMKNCVGCHASYRIVDGRL